MNGNGSGNGCRSTTTTTTAGATTAVAATGHPISTVLAARGKDGRPSDLEFLLRSHCQKLRVVERLAGQAHLILPKVADTTSSLAIQLYDEQDIVAPSRTASQTTTSSSCSSTIEAFLESFQMAVVFILLPLPAQRQEQLDDPNSLFHTIQRAIRRSTNSKENRTGSAHQDNNKTARVCLVSSAQVALTTLVSIVEAISKRPLVHQYFETKARKNYLPVDNGHGRQRVPEACRGDAATHIAEVLRLWADRFNLPPLEISVLMTTLGSLGAIASAEDRCWDGIPVDRRTQLLLRAFFAGQTEPTISSTVTQEQPPMSWTSDPRIPMVAPMNDAEFPPSPPFLTNSNQDGGIPMFSATSHGIPLSSNDIRSVMHPAHTDRGPTTRTPYPSWDPMERVPRATATRTFPPVAPPAFSASFGDRLPDRVGRNDGWQQQQHFGPPLEVQPQRLLPSFRSSSSCQVPPDVVQSTATQGQYYSNTMYPPNRAPERIFGNPYNPAASGPNPGNPYY